MGKELLEAKRMEEENERKRLVLIPQFCLLILSEVFRSYICV